MVEEALAQAKAETKSSDSEKKQFKPLTQEDHAKALAGGKKKKASKKDGKKK